MTRYLRPDLLRAAGIERFDDWASTFGNITTALEQTAYDTYKLKTRFSEFANLPELMTFYKEFADVKSAEKLELPRPALKNGKNTIVKITASPEQKAYVKELGERAEAINMGNVPPHEDNFLKITGEARLIGLGTQTVKSLYARSNRELPPEFVDGEKNGKVDVCAEKVFERWEQSHDVKGVQLVFSDIAVNEDNGNFSAYKYIRDELIAKGVPPEQIIFAPKSDAKDREDISKKSTAAITASLLLLPKHSEQAATFNKNLWLSTIWIFLGSPRRSNNARVGFCGRVTRIPKLRFLTTLPRVRSTVICTLL